MHLLHKIRRFVHDMFCEKDIVSVVSGHMSEHALSLVMTLIMIGGVLFGSKQVAEYTNKTMEVVNQDVDQAENTGNEAEKNTENEAANHQTGKYVVVLDAGHGGRDSGKLSEKGTEEKDINLVIALMIQQRLEESGITVIMTRTEDVGLYTENDSNKKVADMKARLSVIEKSDCDIAISIHQNSYSDSSVRGAQAFYYATSAAGKELAELIQKDLIKNVDQDNHRQAKENDTYYLLKKTSVPMVIVECGFLTCPEEEALLLTDDYQSKIADQIAKSIMSYLTN